jgi:hypothetical protein
LRKSSNMPKAVRTSTRKAASRTNPVNRPRRTTRSNAQSVEKPPNNNRRKPNISTPPLYTRTQDDIAADPNRKVGLFRLPRELLQDIATNHLPLESAICLTLTCKEALSTVGSWPWLSFKALHRWDQARKTLFELLLRTWGSDVWTFCGRCNTMHPPLLPPSRHRKTPLTTYCFGQYACIDHLPHQTDGTGYSPVYDHIAKATKQSEEHASKDMSGPCLDILSGDFTVIYPKLSYRIATSARRIDGNLVLQHKHIFQATSSNRGGLRVVDLVPLPIRLCPHQSTTTSGPKEKSMYIRSIEANSPQLTHAITAAFPTTAQRAGIKTDSFRKPSPQESKDMDAADQGEEVLWRCRSCPTKYRVEYISATGNLWITSWHCFGRDLLHAQDYWKRFVRREGKSLGQDKRNDEWWSPSRSVPAFKIE